ncbi:MAG: end-binding protein Ku, partial [Actinomycetota bacterium]|nr:end-binding protein Ku [Actinomycetota bacterium]
SVRPQELAMAESYITALSGDFDPSEFSDEYRQALEQVIEAKAAGREVKAPAEEAPKSGQVVDLMEALRRSVDEAKARRGEVSSGAGAPAAKKASRQQGAAKKGAAKKTAAKKTATKAPRKKAAKKASTQKAAKKSA